MSFRTITMSIVACWLVLFAGAADAAPDPRPVRIGASLSRTGRLAKLAAFQEKGYRLWVKHVNEQGGMLGRPVELLVYDDASDPDQARLLYQRLIDQDRVDLLFSPYSSDLTEAILPLTQSKGFPLIVAGASADHIWEQGYNHVFGLFLPVSKLAVGFLEMLLRAKIDGIALFHDDGEFGRELAGGVRKWADRFGLTVVVIEQFPRGFREFGDFAARARAAKAQVVICASYLEESIAMRRAFRTIGWQPRVYYAPVGPGTDEFLQTLGKDADGVFSSSQWEAHIARHEQKDVFIDSYLKEYRETPSYFAATAYAAGQILNAAVDRAGSLDRQAIRRALQTMDTKIIIGRYGVDRTGLQIKQMNMVVQIQEGRRMVVWPHAYRTAEPRFP